MFTLNEQKNCQWRIAKRPNGNVKDDDFLYDETEIPTIENGEILLKTLYLNIAPVMRMYMSGDSVANEKSLNIGDVIHGRGVAEVIESKHPNYKVGEIHQGQIGWQTFKKSKVTPAEKFRKIEDYRLPYSIGLSTLGMTGFSAYFGFIDCGKPKENETVVISGAGGMCGSVAAQLAKRRGANVVAISGSKEKNHILETYLNVDKTICYKDIDYEEQLITACRDMGGVDVYMDNVGGILSDVILKEINHNARIPICGQIANYDENISYMDMISNEKGISLEIQKILKDKNAIRKRFLVLDYIEQWPDALEELRNLVVNKELKTVETIDVGFNPGKAFTDMMNGENLGKAIVDIHGSILLNDNDATTYFEKRNDNKYWIVN